MMVSALKALIDGVDIVALQGTGEAGDDLS